MHTNLDKSFINFAYLKTSKPCIEMISEADFSPQGIIYYRVGSYFTLINVSHVNEILLTKCTDLTHVLWYSWIMTTATQIAQLLQI